MSCGLCGVTGLVSYVLSWRLSTLSVEKDVMMVCILSMKYSVQPTTLYACDRESIGAGRLVSSHLWRLFVSLRSMIVPDQLIAADAAPWYLPRLRRRFLYNIGWFSFSYSLDFVASMLNLPQVPSKPPVNCLSPIVYQTIAVSSFPLLSPYCIFFRRVLARIPHES